MSSNNIITGTVIADDFHIRGERPVAERALEGESVSLVEMEAHYKKPGGTLLHAVFGADPFDFFIGRFYLGTFGVLSLLGIVLGTFFYFYQVWIVEGTFNLLAARIDPPTISAGLSLVGPGEPGFIWQLIVFFATIAFVGWALRQVDIARKLGMSQEIAIAYFAVVSSWLTLQWLRPIAMGAWGNGFALGITHHLDWVSNIGYQYFNFFYNPFHAIGITLLFTSTLLLAMHGSLILMNANRPYTREANEDGFFRNLLGYSIGEIGLHRLAFWVGTASVLFSNLCIFLSGTLVHDWVQIWNVWNRIPIWQGAATMGAIVIGVVIWRRPRSGGDRLITTEEQEYPKNGIESTTIQEPIHVGFLERLFDLGQIGPLYVGVWGVISLAAGVITSFIVIEHYLWAVGYDPVMFLREFWVLSIDPPPAEFGLGFSETWHGGSNWIFATFFLHVSVLAWLVRIQTRAEAGGLGSKLSWGFGGALFLYFAIYLFRPVIMGNWAQAPGHGFKAVLDWTNHVSVQYGNFYYNPFHMLSIFFLLGSTLLLAMHGATIVATSRWGSYRELEEMVAEGSGTQRAQLFWRWCMGFQATSKSIHEWLWWFALLCGVTGGIGILLSGTLVLDWFQWAIDANIVAPPF